MGGGETTEKQRQRRPVSERLRGKWGWKASQGAVRVSLHMLPFQTGLPQPPISCCPWLLPVTSLLSNHLLWPDPIRVYICGLCPRLDVQSSRTGPVLFMAFLCLAHGWHVLTGWLEGWMSGWLKAGRREGGKEDPQAQGQGPLDLGPDSSVIRSAETRRIFRGWDGRGLKTVVLQSNYSIHDWNK